MQLSDRAVQRGKKELLDDPMHYHAPFSEDANVIINGDAGVLAAVPAVGAEAPGEATVAEDNDVIADIARPKGPTPDGMQVRR